MIEPAYNDTSVSYEEKGDVREYLGSNETKDKDDDDSDDYIADQLPSGNDGVIDDAVSDEAPDQSDEENDGVSDPDIEKGELQDEEANFLGYKKESDTDSDYDSSDEENYQKLETDINSKNLLEKHPCAIEHSYQEIQAFTKIIRNEKGEIIDELHKTLPFLTKYEYARIIGVRTKELNEGAEPFVDVDNNIIDGYNIAIKELEEKKLPFIVKRPLPNGSCEYWKLADLELIHF